MLTRVSIQQLSRFAIQSLDWFERHLDSFDPFISGPEPDLRRSKMLLELISLCRYYKRITAPAIAAARSEQIDAFLDFARIVWEKPAFNEQIARRPEHLRLYGMTYLHLRNCGTVPSAFDDLIQRIVDDGYATAVESVAFRILDTRHMLDSGAIEHTLPSYQDLFQLAMISKDVPVARLRDDDVYAITHEIYYLSDFGRRELSSILGSELPRIRELIGSLLAVYLQQENWDLVAELLLACRCLKDATALAFQPAWQGLIEAQRPSGRVPGPNFHPDAQEEFNEQARYDYYISENYHTTLVSALAAILTIDWMRESCARTGQQHLQKEDPAPSPQPSCPKARMALLAADHWLSDTHTPRTPLPLQSRLTAFLACWSCDNGLGRSPSPLLYEMAGALEQSIEQDEETLTERLLQYDIVSALLSLGVMRKIGAAGAAAEAAIRYIGRAAQDLPLGGDDLATSAAETYPVRLLLHSLGIRSQRPIRPALRVPPTRQLLQSSDRRVKDHLAKAVMAATDFGHVPDCLDLDDRKRSAAALEAWALTSLRQYQLTHAAMMLRAAGYLNVGRSYAADQGRAFLLSQQRSDGAFGFIGEEISRLGLEARRLELDLSISAQCIWMLAESARPGFALLHSVKPQIPGRRTASSIGIDEAMLLPRDGDGTAVRWHATGDVAVVQAGGRPIGESKH